jgi:hypothetical protein
MECKVIPYSVDEHYETVSQWWATYHDGEGFPKDCLPDSGAIVLRGDKPVAVTFFYKTNSKMVWLHFAMADPSLGAGRRVDFVRMAIAGAIEMAKDHLQGEGHIWCCTDNAVVARLYAENGMTCPGEADIYFLPVGNQSQDFMK